MSTKTDYTPEEWKILLVAPYYAAMLIVVADPNLGFVSELAALAQSVTLSSTQSKIEFIREVATELGKKETQEMIKPELQQMQGQKDPLVLQQTLLDSVVRAADLVGEHSSEDGTAYRKWLLYLAGQTAQGSKEGSFLGIGGVRVSQKEKAMLADLAQSLGVEAPPASE
jgi:hypothetical protein